MYGSPRFDCYSRALRCPLGVVKEGKGWSERRFTLLSNTNYNLFNQPQPMRPKVRALNALHPSRNTHLSAVVQIAPFRPLTTARVTASALDSTHLQTPPSRHLDPRTVSNRDGERKLIRSGLHPIGSRRRRAALRTSRNIPFEHLPYQCFQETRKILQQDRQEKIKLIETQRGRIERLKTQVVGHPGNVLDREKRLASMGKYLEELKIWADINDPMVKKRFEDGQGIQPLFFS